MNILKCQGYAPQKYRTSKSTNHAFGEPLF